MLRLTVIEILKTRPSSSTDSPTRSFASFSYFTFYGTSSFNIWMTIPPHLTSQMPFPESRIVTAQDIIRDPSSLLHKRGLDDSGCTYMSSFSSLNADFLQLGLPSMAVLSAQSRMANTLYTVPIRPMSDIRLDITVLHLMHWPHSQRPFSGESSKKLNAPG